MLSLPLSRSGREAVAVASQAAEEAGSLLLKHMYGQLKLGQKEGRANLVTDLDVAAEKMVIGVLQDEYPDFNIVSEESPAVSRDSQFTWVIDPLDGTNNYVHGIPFICVSIGLALGQEAVMGVIYDPVRKELFTARKGHGAFLNGLPISVAKRNTIGEAFLGVDLGYDADKGRAMLDFVKLPWPDIGGLRLIGSAALGLTYVACGRLDAYIHPLLYPWDVAAAICLVRESGGKITDWQDRPATIETKVVAAANETLHGQFLKLIQGQEPLRF